MITTNSTAAKGYSDYQDLLTQAKDYQTEVNCLEKLIRQYAGSASRILDIGCGTGPHAFLLAEKGYFVSGVECNERFIEAAHKRLASVATEIRSRLTFHKFDARHLSLDQKYEVVTAMYNVIGYMTSNRDVADLLSSVSRHLAPHGIFICDFWYGPAFLASPPRLRIRKGERENLSYLQVAEPALAHERDQVDVNYTLLVRNKETSTAQEFDEKGSYRYFFMPEMEVFLDAAGLELVDVRSFLTDLPLSLETRELSLVARKKA